MISIILLCDKNYASAFGQNKRPLETRAESFLNRSHSIQKWLQQYGYPLGLLLTVQVVISFFNSQGDHPFVWFVQIIIEEMELYWLLSKSQVF